LQGTLTLVQSENEFQERSIVTEPVSAVVVDIDLNANYIKITRLLDILNKNPDCLFFSGAPDKKIPVTPTLNTAGKFSTKLYVLVEMMMRYSLRSPGMRPFAVPSRYIYHHSCNRIGLQKCVIAVTYVPPNQAINNSKLYNQKVVV